MFKNTASQKVRLYAFIPSTGLPKTGDAANLTAYVSKDWGAVTALTDTSATEVDATNAKGVYTFDVTQSETNFDVADFTCKSSTADVSVVPLLNVQSFPNRMGTLLIDSSGKVSPTDGSIGTATFAAGAINAAAIGADAITAAKVATDVLEEIRDKVGERTTLRGTVGAASTTTSVTTSAMTPATSVADQLKGQILQFHHDTTTAALRGQKTDITASSASGTPTLTVTALTTAPVSGDTFTIG